MLKSIDILIGVTSVMLLFSMAVTVITEGATHMLNLRGKELRKGLADLLRQLSTNISVQSAQEIATRVLAQPLIGEPSLFGSTPIFARPRLLFPSGRIICSGDWFPNSASSFPRRSYGG